MSKKSRTKTPAAQPSRPAPAPAGNARAAAWLRGFTVGAAACGLLLTLWAVVLAAGRAGELQRYAGWGEYAGVIADNKVAALWHGALMTFAAAAALWFFLLSRVRSAAARQVAAWALVLIVAGDAVWLSRHYIKTMPLSALEENAVTRLLKADMPEHRAALLSQDGFYNWWLTYLFPYLDIKTVNFTQMPRMPADYANYLAALQRNPTRYWQLAAVGHVLAPAELWNRLQHDRPWQTALTPVLRYDVTPEESGVRVIPAAPGAPGRHLVLRLTLPSPRYALVAGWRTMDDKSVLERLPNPAFTPFETVLVAPECAAGLPASASAGMTGSVERVSYRPGRVVLNVNAPQAAMLRAADKYDSDWKAWVDDSPAPVRRVDYIAQGVFIPAGRHTLRMEYAPVRWPLYIQGLGFLIVLGAALALMAGALRRRRETLRDAAA